MTYQELDTAVLTRDLPAHGLRAGDLGAIVAVMGPKALEVEFVRVSGESQALVTLSPDDLRPVDAYDLVAVRPCPPPSPTRA